MHAPAIGMSAMSNPKDWFRRRPALNGLGGPSVDPFNGDAVLDLGHSAAATREAAPAAIGADNPEHAAFTLAAPGVSWKRSRSPVTETGGVSARLRDAFTPTRPKQNAALFSGRYKQMQRIIAAIEEE